MDGTAEEEPEATRRTPPLARGAVDRPEDERDVGDGGAGGDAVLPEGASPKDEGGTSSRVT